MKIKSVLKNTMLVALLIILSNCSSEDHELNIIHETTKTEILQTKAVPNRLVLYITFNFEQGMTVQEKLNFRNSYAQKMKRFFTIYNRSEGAFPCENKEKWVVNKSEYRTYQLRPETSADHKEGDPTLGEIEPISGSCKYGPISTSTRGSGLQHSSDEDEGSNGDDSTTDSFGNFH